MVQALKCFLYILFPRAACFLETTFPRLLTVKLALVSPPMVFTRVPFMTCHFFPRIETFLAFLRRRTTRLADLFFVALRLVVLLFLFMVLRLADLLATIL